MKIVLFVFSMQEEEYTIILYTNISIHYVRVRAIKQVVSTLSRPTKNSRTRALKTP